MQVSIESGNTERLFERLFAHQIDVILANSVPLRDSRTNWTAHLIDEQPVSLIGHPGQIEKGLPLARALMAAPLILPSGESSIRSDFDALVERLNISPRIAAQGDDMAMLRLLTRDGAGLAVIPPIVVRDELSNGVLEEIAQLPGLVEAFYAITLVRRFSNPMLKEMIMSL